MMTSRSNATSYSNYNNSYNNNKSIGGQRNNNNYDVEYNKSFVGGTTTTTNNNSKKDDERYSSTTKNNGMKIKTPKSKTTASTISLSVSASLSSSSNHHNNNTRATRISYHQSISCLLIILSIIILLRPSPIFDKVQQGNNQQQQQQQFPLMDFTNSKSRLGTLLKHVQSLDDDGSKISYVPIEPFNECNGRIEKVVCQTTVLFEARHGIPNMIITEKKDNDDDSAQQNKEKICNILLNMEQSVTGIPGEYDYSPFFVIRVPVCVQTYSKVGIVVIEQAPKNDAKNAITDENTENTVDTTERKLESNKNSNELKLLQSLEDDNNANVAIQRFITSVLFMAEDYDPSIRVIPLKRIDFTAYYQLGMYTKPTDSERFRDTNYGNMVWRYASTKLINPITNEIDINFRLSLNNFTNRPPIDAMVVATANTLHLTSEPKLQSLIETYTDRVVANNVPTIVIGIGIQNQFDNSIMQTLQKENSANITDQFHLTLTHPFQEKFLRTISQYQTQPAIGVRGDMTKSVCTNSGINNCVSIGCPSLTISRDTNLGRTIETKLEHVYDKLNEYEVNPTKNNNNDNEPLKVAITCPADAMSSSFETIASIIDAFGIEHSTIIIQSERDRNNVKTFMSTKWIDINPNTIIRDPDALQFLDFMNVETWLQTASAFDLCISFRIHGSMTFIGSGIPTIVLPTDFRIMELVYAMQLPHILPSALDGIVHNHLEQITKPGGTPTYKQSQLVLSLLHAAYDDLNFEEFELNRRSKIQGWKSILNVANIEMDPSLLRIISTDRQ